MSQIVENIVEKLVSAADSLIELLLGNNASYRLKRVELRAFTDPRQTLHLRGRMPRHANSPFGCDRY